MTVHVQSSQDWLAKVYISLSKMAKDTPQGQDNLEAMAQQDQPLGTPGQTIEMIQLWQVEMFDRRWKETKWMDYPLVHSAELEKHKDDPNAWLEYHPMDNQGMGALKTVAADVVLKTMASGEGGWRPKKSARTEQEEESWQRNRPDQYVHFVHPHSRRQINKEHGFPRRLRRASIEKEEFELPAKVD